LNNSHVLPAMIRKFHDAKVNGGPVVLWGDGSAFREFLYSDDLADAVVYLLENKDFADIGEFVNIGSGSEVTIRQLSETIARIVGYAGEVQWDTTKPNGTPRKLMDSGRLFALGWKPKVGLEDGIRKAYADFLSRYA